MSLLELQEHFVVHSIEKRELSNEGLAKDLNMILDKIQNGEYQYNHTYDKRLSQEIERILYHIEQGQVVTFEEYMIIAIFVLSLKETSNQL